MTFEVYTFRFRFCARDRIVFPPGGPANVLRGAFGSALQRINCSPGCPGLAGRSARECERRAYCPYARIFEPGSLGSGPSGLADRPRPFVFRSAHLNGCCPAPGESFWFDVNLFETRTPVIEHFEQAFARMAEEGFGPGRGRALLESAVQIGPEGRPAQGPPISIPLVPASTGARALRVEFLTPTELTSGERAVDQPEFGVLFARARDRVSTLGALYGAGAPDIDFRSMGERASAIRMTRCQLRYVEAGRRSSRTGAVHSLGGFLGEAEYEGALDEFLPYLEAARWTGVGRHCVWGKGEIRPCVLMPRSVNA